MRKFLALLPLLIVAAVVAASMPRYHREKAACEQQGGFYWRGSCLPMACSPVHP